jgi:predicted RNA-binding protein with RPS1 domain
MCVLTILWLVGCDRLVDAFMPGSFVAKTHFLRPFVTPVAMSSKTLASLQEKYSSREDLPCMFHDDGEDDILLDESMLEGMDLECEAPPVVGQTVTGYVIDVDDNAALLAINGKKSGIIPVAEAGLLPVKHLPEVIKVGDTVTAEMIGTLKGMPVISIRATQLIQAWKNVSDTRTAEETFAVRVLEVNKGGAVCSAFGGLRAFLPGSHHVGPLDPSVIGSTIMV